ncbi:retrotrans_gag domain-containing protein [Trichonephila clavipes]|nr:retrotrans_gag domain-containing protein [Trichonephila clavipes]
MDFDIEYECLFTNYEENTEREREREREDRIHIANSAIGTCSKLCVWQSSSPVGHVLSPVLYRAPSVRINLIVCLIELCTSFSNSVTSLVEAPGTITSNVDNSDSLRRSLRLRGLSPEFGLLKENSRKRTKMPTEQEAKPAVVTPSLQQWRSPSTFRGAPGEDPLKWLKEYDQ